MIYVADEYQIEGWAAAAKEIFVWDYSANFSYLCCPLPNFETMLANAQYMRGLGVSGVFNNAVTGNIGELAELRAYMLTRVYRDPYMTGEEFDKHMNGFLRAWYGPGWKAIREFIDLCEEFSSSMGIYIFNAALLKSYLVADEADPSSSKDFGCNAKPVGMYDYSLVAEKADHLRALWDTAAEKAETDLQRANVARSRICCEFLVQCALYEPMMVNGTEAEQAAYRAANDALYNEITVVQKVKWSESRNLARYSSSTAPEDWV